MVSCLCNTRKATLIRRHGKMGLGPRYGVTFGLVWLTMATHTSTYSNPSFWTWRNCHVFPFVNGSAWYITKILAFTDLQQCGLLWFRDKWKPLIKTANIVTVVHGRTTVLKSNWKFCGPTRAVAKNMLQMERTRELFIDDLLRRHYRAMASARTRVFPSESGPAAWR